MSDLIRRKDAIKALQELDLLKESRWSALAEANPIQFVCRMYLETENVIEALPSAEPERMKGEWIVQPSTGDDRPNIWWKCSVCGQVIFSETERDRREFHAFCGRCGADMRGEE